MKLKRILMLKMSGDDVRWVQTRLKEYGYHKNIIDGNFTQNTLVSVTNYQRSVGIKADGVIGPQTWSQITNHLENKKEKESKGIETDVVITPTPRNENIPFKISYIGEDSLTIYDCFLEDDEYYKTETVKDTIWLHHTAGGSRPDWTIGGWERDFQKDKKGNAILDKKGNPKPLRVGTQFVIGRSSSSKNDILWDGKVLRSFDDRHWAYHLDISHTKSKALNSKSIGIEICNYGPLTLGKDGRYYNYVNQPINDEDVVELDKPFRGYTHYERYTDAQIESTRKLILYLKKRWDIQIETGIYDEQWFEYDVKWFSHGGLRNNTQVRTGKFDIFPQKEMIEMLNTL
jgi:peptidoglycan hydrolase-like protein with peptidoglycan-binding domain